MKNKVSIIIPSYNHSIFLEDRIKSIINQTYQNWELIIIDDKSNDDSIDKLRLLLKNYNHKIKYFIVNKTNSGSGYNSWKKGIELAETDFIWIAETDDYSDLFFLEESINLLEKDHKISLVFSSSIYVNKDKEFLYSSKNRTKELNVKKGEVGVFRDKYFLKAAISNPYITNGSSVVFRKKNTKKLPSGIFEKGLSTDIFLWTFLVIGNKFGFVNKPLNFFRRHSNSTTEKINNNKLKQIYIEKIDYLNYFKLANNYNPLLDSYIKNYIFKNKKEILNSKFLNRLETKDNVQIQYYKFLIKQIIKKIKNKI